MAWPPCSRQNLVLDDPAFEIGLVLKLVLPNSATALLLEASSLTLSFRAVVLRHGSRQEHTGQGS